MEAREKARGESERGRPRAINVRFVCAPFRRADRLAVDEKFIALDDKTGHRLADCDLDFALFSRACSFRARA